MKKSVHQVVQWPELLSSLGAITSLEGNNCIQPSIESEYPATTKSSLILSIGVKSDRAYIGSDYISEGHRSSLLSCNYVEVEWAYENL